MPTITDPNRSRSIQAINGFQGVSAGSNMSVSIPADRRLHRLKLLCSAVNYTGGTGLATTKLTGSGNNNLTVTPTIVKGAVTAAAVVAGGTGYTTGDTVTITDATGTGCVLTVTANAGVVTALAVTSGGTASAISPISFFDSLTLQVGAVTMRNVSPQTLLMLSQARGIMFEPRRTADQLHGAGSQLHFEQRYNFLGPGGRC